MRTDVLQEQPDVGSVEAEDKKQAAAETDLSMLSDEELADLLGKDVFGAFDILVERYKDQLLNFIFRFLGDMDTSQDILQETFIRIFDKRCLYKQCGRFSTWAYTIAANLARSELRRPFRRFTIPLSKRDTSGEEYELPVIDEAPRPDRVADSRQKYRRIQDALLRLPAIFREAVILCDIQELRYEEIALILDQPIGTVKSRINRGRAMLRKMLRDIYD